MFVREDIQVIGILEHLPRLMHGLFEDTLNLKLVKY